MKRKEIGKLKDNFNVGEKVKVKGRIIAKRSFGKIIFFELSQDRKIQLVAKLDFNGKDFFSQIREIDVGDIISVTGEAWLSKSGEKSVLIEKYKIFSNNGLREFEGYKKVERDKQYKKNYLELSVDKEKFNYHKNCSILISSIRNQLFDREFLEFYTGILQSNFESGLARPFKTHSRAIDREVYLRATTEIKLKKLLAGGYEKIFELGPLFRNEGIGSDKTPEFLLLDCYWTYKNYKDMMSLFEEIMKKAIEKSFGKIITTKDGLKIDITSPWKRITFEDLLSNITGIENIPIENKRSLQKIIQNEGINLSKKMSEGRMINKILGSLIFPEIIEPTYVTEIPAAALPLAATSSEDERKAQGAILIIDGLFIGDTYNDESNPKKIEKVLKKQAKIADKEVNQEFLELLKFGIPPSAGFGLGINQLLLSMKREKERDVRETFVHSFLK